MNKKKRDFCKIVHLDKTIHGKLKLAVINKQLKGEKTTIALETEKAILAYLKNSV